MSFTLRQVTERAGGGEIIRTRRLDLASFMIGRGTECELQLHDLALSLRQARMSQTGPASVLVEAEAGQDFEADGRFVTRAALDIARGARLVFGSHVVTLARGTGVDEIVATISHLPAEARRSGDEETRIFAPARIGLSKRGAAWVLWSAIIAVCLALPVGAFYLRQNPRLHADSQWTSGPLSRAHAFLEKDCQSCHTKAFVAVRDEACQSCHQAGRAPGVQQAVALRVRGWGEPDAPRSVAGHADPVRLTRAAPLSGELSEKVQAMFRRAFDHPNDRCASCHREHLDAVGQKVGQTMNGASRTPVRARPTLVMTQGCAGCHGGMKGRLPDTPLPDVPSWRGHPDFRPLVVAAPGVRPALLRVALTATPRENSGLTFPHDVHLLPTGGVARMGQVLGVARGYGGALTCASCHRSDAAGQGFKPVNMTRDCAACHSLAFARVGGELKLLPHGKPDQVVATMAASYGPAGGGQSGRHPPGEARADRQVTPGLADAVRGVFSRGGACFDCHIVTPPRVAGGLDWGVTPVRLSASYLPRGGFNHAIPAHRKDAKGRETCNDCHKAGSSTRASDLLLPRISQCRTCHGQTKASAPAGAVPAGTECKECHSYHAPGRPERKTKNISPANGDLPDVSG